MPSPSRLDPELAVQQRAVDHHLALTTDGGPALAAPAQNASYTLCVLTGAGTVEDALSPMRALCSGSMTASLSPSRTLKGRTTQHSSRQTEALT